jgi:hypothetical protein
MGNSSADKLRLAPQGNWSLHAQQPKARAAVSEVPLLDHACERFTDGRRNVPSTLSTTGVRSRAPIFRETTLCFAFLVPSHLFCRVSSNYSRGPDSSGHRRR